MPSSSTYHPIAQATEHILLRGVRTHNLKNVDLDIPHGKLVVITGPSGSGKSSLAFDTIFAEGQRQFIDSLSIEARRYFDQIERPDADLIEGLQPTICIDQRRSRGNRRSTVATLTEIYDHLRLLFARAGEVHCKKCKKEIRRSSAAQIQKWVENLPEKTRLMVLAPLTYQATDDQATKPFELLANIRKDGFVRVRINGELHDVDDVDPDQLSFHAKSSGESADEEAFIEVVIDRLIVRDGFQSRLAESIQHALKIGEQSLVVMYESDSAQQGNTEKAGRVWLEERFCTRFSCTTCQIEYDEIEPRSFSFNSPHGACETCNGMGVIDEFDLATIIPDWNRPLSEAIVVWKHLTKPAVSKQKKILNAFLEKHSLCGRRLSVLDAVQRETFLRGDSDKFLGLMNLLEQEFVTALDSDRYDELLAYRGKNDCTTCRGSRLKEQANYVTICGESMLSVINMTIVESLEFFRNLSALINPTKAEIVQRVAPEIIQRLEFLEQVGAAYLTLGRPVTTLSGGEFQRVRLATGIGSGLAGVCYVLDEPCIGLHQRDNQRLIDALKNLQRQGNTLIVVEHDESMMREAEHIVDVGPKAGSQGGEIIATGTLDEIVAHKDSLTGQYLSGAKTLNLPTQSRTVDLAKTLTLTGATENNLKNVDVTIPLNVFTCITGVSGSGKSTLINSTLIPALARQLGGAAAQCGRYKSISGVSKIQAVVKVDQAPLGRSSRSNAATYTGLFAHVRKIFAATKEAKQLGFTASQFSFNAKAGRCEECRGHGFKKVEMGFMADVQVTCEVCNGQRFNRQTLQAKFKNRSIADVLAMSIDDATSFFGNHERIGLTLRCMQQVGLGYLSLGQSASTLSGGEAQRVKLAASLANPSAERTIYFLDEPTTGLHFDDIKRLLSVLQQLVDKGNSVVVIEHDLAVARQADWIIDMGPNGGTAGGEIIATGRPDEITKCEQSITGQYLTL